jgi:hypothetical protein
MRTIYCKDECSSTRGCCFGNDYTDNSGTKPRNDGDFFRWPFGKRKTQKLARNVSVQDEWRAAGNSWFMVRTASEVCDFMGW